MELLAARRVVKFSIKIGFRHAVFEGDSEVVIKSIQGNGMLNSMDSHIIKDILSYANLLQSSFFSHVCRRGNVVAHFLA